MNIEKEFDLTYSMDIYEKHNLLTIKQGSKIYDAGFNKIKEAKVMARYSYNNVWEKAKILKDNENITLYWL